MVFIKLLLFNFIESRKQFSGKNNFKYLADLSESNEFWAISATNCGSDTTWAIRPRHSAAQHRTIVFGEEREPEKIKTRFVLTKFHSW